MRVTEKKRVYDRDTLLQLVNEKFSCITLRQCERKICLRPIYLSKIKTGIKEALDSNINKFDARLMGFTLDYQNLKALPNANNGRIVGKFGEFEVNITVEFFIFQPETGSLLEGVVNVKTDNHVGVLVHKYFNARILKPDDLDFNKWNCKNIKIGDKIVFEVVETNFLGLVPYIEGKIPDDSENCNKSKDESRLTITGDNDSLNGDTALQNGDLSPNTSYLTDLGLNQSEDSSYCNSSPEKRKKNKHKKKETASNYSDSQLSIAQYNGDSKHDGEALDSEYISRKVKKKTSKRDDKKECHEEVQDSIEAFSCSSFSTMLSSTRNDGGESESCETKEKKKKKKRKREKEQSEQRVELDEENDAEVSSLPKERHKGENDVSPEKKPASALPVQRSLETFSPFNVSASNEINKSPESFEPDYDEIQKICNRLDTILEDGERGSSIGKEKKKNAETAEESSKVVKKTNSAKRSKCASNIETSLPIPAAPEPDTPKEQVKKPRKRKKDKADSPSEGDLIEKLLNAKKMALAHEDNPGNGVSAILTSAPIQTESIGKSTEAKDEEVLAKKEGKKGKKAKEEQEKKKKKTEKSAKASVELDSLINSLLMEKRKSLGLDEGRTDEAGKKKGRKRRGEDDSSLVEKPKKSRKSLKFETTV